MIPMTTTPLSHGSAGRVVLELDTARTLACWAGHANCDVSEIRSRFRFDDTGLRYETGKIDTPTYFASLRSMLPAGLTDAQLLEGWTAMFVGVMPGMDALLERAARHLPLDALSNTNPAHEAYFLPRFAETFGHFRTIYTSSTIGHMKPDAAAYDHVVEAIGMPAQRIVFFDDLATNIEGARARGLSAVHVTSVRDVADALAALGI